MLVLYMRMWPRINDILTGNLFKMHTLRLCKLHMMLITGVHCNCRLVSISSFPYLLLYYLHCKMCTALCLYPIFYRSESEVISRKWPLCSAITVLFHNSPVKDIISRIYFMRFLFFCILLFSPYFFHVELQHTCCPFLLSCGDTHLVQKY